MPTDADRDRFDELVQIEREKKAAFEDAQAVAIEGFQAGTGPTLEELDAEERAANEWCNAKVAVRAHIRSVFGGQQ